MIAAIAAQRVIPVLRARDVADAVDTARACARAGLRIVELTRTTPDVEQAVHALVDDGLTVGVGTIRSGDEVRSAAAAGAAFVVSFHRPGDFMAAATAAGVLAIPGALTPHEVAACADAGARVVKLFPARSLTPAYLRDLAPVLPDLRFVVTGGIEPGATAPWLRAGALAVGLGSALGTVAAEGADEVERRCRAALEASASAD